MARPSRWIAGLLSLQIVLGASAPAPDAAAVSARAPDSTHTAPSRPAARCLLPEERHARESADCTSSIQADLAAGRIALAEAVARLERCAASRPAFREHLQASARRRAELYRARVAFGETLDEKEAEDFARLTQQLARSARVPSAAAVRALRASGITPAGIDAAARPRALARLQSDASLRRAFRDVFGDGLAGDLDRLLARGEGADARAMVIGGSVLLPAAAAGAPGGSRGAGLRVVALEDYTSRVVSGLDSLDASRARFLASASRSSQTASSVRAHLRWARSLGRVDERLEAARQADADRQRLLARLADLRLRLGLDPVLFEMAREDVAFATELDGACQQLARRRQRWIHAGSLGVAGLMGAAGVVVATGATGTMAGGVTIAAALEAALGLYLVARTERIGEYTPDEESPADSASAEKTRRFRDPDREGALEQGRSGYDHQDQEDVEEESGEGSELEGGEGEGEEDQEGTDEEERAEPRKNTIPPLLPQQLPEALLELPPMLDPEATRDLRRLSLAEVQQRLDEFLVAPPPAPRPAAARDDELVEEALDALRLWKERRELSAGFGEFFVRAELEEIPASKRAETFARAMDRYGRDRAAYRASTGLEDLRERVAARLVTHCRATPQRGDLMLAACADGTALTMVVIAAVRDAGVPLPPGGVLGVQAVGEHFQPVLFFEHGREVLSLTDGKRVQGVVGPVFHPASFYYTYLLDRGVDPQVDPEQHLRIAHADPGMEPPATECVAARRGVFARVIDWVRSTVGVPLPSRRGAKCGGPADGPAAEPQGSRGAARGAKGGSDRGSRGGPARPEGGVSVGVNLPSPRLPLPRMGGGQSGGGGQGGGGGGGGGGGQAGQAGGGRSGGEGGSGGGGGGSAAGGGAAGGAGQPGASPAAGAGAGGQGSGAGAGGSGRGGAAGSGGGEASEGATGAAAGSTARDAAGATELGAGSEGQSAGEGGDGPAVDLGEIARETVEMREKHEESGPLRVGSWRLRADSGFTVPSARVLYAANAPALSWFKADDRFITLSPADAEGQRRMLEADAHPVFPAGTTCASRGLPPRRVFRRVADGSPGFRYVFCDQAESLVIFKERPDALDYARMRAPDRPLYLTRLGSEKLEDLDRSVEIARVRAFLEDPDVLRDYSPAEVEAMVKTVESLLTFQHTLESALVQSMEELEESGVRSYYYDLHRQVLHGPFFLGLSEGTYRFNRRLASEPLQALAWANALPAPTRQGFFQLYHALGRTMVWPERWEALQRQFGGTRPGGLRRADEDRPTLDFLQILSDPTRVRVDWRAEQPIARPSIRDRKIQQGKERAPDERPEPTDAEEAEKQNATERKKGGTRGLGRTGAGESLGPDRGKRPLQMIQIRIVRDSGEPVAPKLAVNNETRPGGTRGKKKQEEVSASRQEPVLWVAPRTLADAVLSTWEHRDLSPAEAGRVPPILRFDQRLRQLFVREMDRGELYQTRIMLAMEPFTAGGWLRFAEAREAMGGRWTRIRAQESSAGRFRAELSRNAPINDQEQIRVPNFFTRDGVVIPADLLDSARRHFARKHQGYFELSSSADAGPVSRIGSLPVGAGDADAQARENVLRSLRIMAEQTRAQD